MEHKKLYSTALVILLIVTFVAIVLQFFLLEKTLLLHPDNTSSVHVVTDQSVGGNSVAKLTEKEEKWLIECNIIASDYNWLFANSQSVSSINKKIPPVRV